MLLPAFPNFSVRSPVAAHFPALHEARRMELLYRGDCVLVGVDRTGQIGVEEYYDDWLAQYLFAADGTLLAVSDEQYGEIADPPSIASLEMLTAPQPVGQAAALNYGGGRWRGLREEERTTDLAAPLSVSEKMALAEHAIPGPILGLIESYVLAEAPIHDKLSLICRRLRLAYAVPRQLDDDGQPFDYDTQVIYLAQWFDPQVGEAPLDTHTLHGLCPRPMDALSDGSRLVIASGGGPETPSAVYIYHLLDAPLPASMS